MAPNNLSAKEIKENDASLSPSTRLVVIGASAGGFEGLKTIIKNLPPDFDLPIFIVWHLGADGQGVLPKVLNQVGAIHAGHAYDQEPIKRNHIYVAPPDYHLLVEEGKVRVTHGPKENRFRPAVDPLFRSAAYAYGNRMIGIILSGGLDDGTAGLWAIKHYGGVTIIQDPEEAEVSSMPDSARQKVAIDYCVGVAEMPELLIRLSKEPLPENVPVMKEEQTKKEIDIAADANGMERGKLIFDELTPFTCPECHGVLSRLHEDNIIRYRCHTGHAFSVNSLMTALTEKIEENMYNVLRGMDESVLLLNHLGDHLAEDNQPGLAAVYFNKAKDIQERSRIIRDIALMQEQLDTFTLEREAESSSEIAEKKH